MQKSIAVLITFILVIARPNILFSIISFLYLISNLVSKSSKIKIKVLINSKSKVNIIILVYTVKLDLATRKTKMSVLKIDSLFLKTDKMTIAKFLV